jgi:hypothetical protein
VGTPACAPTCTQAQDKPPAKAGATPGKTLTLDPTAIQKPWTGDLDGMIQRRLIRVLTVHETVAVRTGGEVGWAFRQGSPQLKAALDDFVTRHKAGEQGAALQGALAVSPGVWLYQLTETGLALELTAKGTKYYKDDALN